jgi:hypothetical protein
MRNQHKSNAMAFIYRFSFTFVLTFAAFALVFAQKQPSATYSSYHDVSQAFKNPPADFRSTPLWVWNDRMTEQEIDEQLMDFKEHGIGGVFIHPRPGLITPYLSDEWLSLC